MKKSFVIIIKNYHYKIDDLESSFDEEYKDFLKLEIYFRKKEENYKLKKF